MFVIPYSRLFDRLKQLLDKAEDHHFFAMWKNAK